MESGSSVSIDMRVTYPESNKDRSERNAISSMVDIAFLLLIFFIVATTIMPTEQDLVMKLPVRNGESMTDLTPVWVEILEDSSVVWGQGDSAMVVASAGASSDLPDLREGLRTAVAASGDRDLPVMLKTHDGVAQQRFIDVLNCFAACGVNQVAMVETE